MGQVNMSWTDPVKANGIIIGYSVKYKKLPGDEVQILEINGLKKWVVIGNLKPAALYQFSVAAKTKAGIGSYRKKKFDFTWRKFLAIDFHYLHYGVETTLLGLFVLYYIIASR